METVNGEEVYVVKKNDKTYYYSTKTGLKTGEAEKQSMAGKEGVIPTYFSDYQEVEGVKYPFTLKQNLGGMDVSFAVKEYQINKATEADFK